MWARRSSDERQQILRRAGPHQEGSARGIPQPPSPPPEPAKIGRPPGKRSNRTIMMHKHTHEIVARILLETDDTRDLSELVDD